jgi:hypothetical protein
MADASGAKIHKAASQHGTSDFHTLCGGKEDSTKEQDKKERRHTIRINVVALSLLSHNIITLKFLATLSGSGAMWCGARTPKF